VTILILPECDDSMLFPAPDAKGKANVCDNRGTLRNVRNRDRENIDLWLTWANYDPFTTIPL